MFWAVVEGFVARFYSQQNLGRHSSLFLACLRPNSTKSGQKLSSERRFGEQERRERFVQRGKMVILISELQYTDVDWNLERKIRMTHSLHMQHLQQSFIKFPCGSRDASDNVKSSSEAREIHNRA